MRWAAMPLALALVAVAAPGAGTSGTATFRKDIQPILAKSCWKCHGAAVQLSRLDLRTREGALKGGEKGPSIIPGKATESRLFRLVAGLEKPAMPMDGKLSTAEIEAFRQWIDSGAAWDADASADGAAATSVSDLEGGELPPGARDYWAFRLPVKRPPPQIANFTHPIDRFLERERAKKGLHAAPRADARTLVRRAYLDLLGMPPSPEEVDAFVSDTSAYAWEKLLDRLLASPHYGERWGRHWLDVARYADSNGFEHDFNRPNAWRYRDYVIRSFNRDTPYNVFLAEQLAGDELDWVSRDSLIATGFLRNYAKVGFREKDNPQFRYEYLDDMIATIGRGILGLTVQCARCHNHKFDPILQKDYYKLQASLFGYVEVDHPLVPKGQADAYYAKLADISARMKPLQSKIREIEAPYREQIVQEKYKKYPQNIQEAIATPEEKRTPGQQLLAGQVIRTTSASSDEIRQLLNEQERSQIEELRGQIREIENETPKPIPVAMGVTDGDYRFAPDGPGDEPAPGKGVKQDVTEGSFLTTGHDHYEAPPSYFLIRGDLQSRGSKMFPGFVTVATNGNHPTAIPPPSGHTSGRRRALAEWLGSRDNPLTARVIVNRIWHHHFGRGIVPTVDNFGKSGELPSHPELLDWLAVEFMDRGWSIKQMQRLIMTSEAYRMAAQFDDGASRQADPMNRLLWRFQPQRLDAEIVRDSILAVAGTLNAKMGGPSVFPPLPDDVLKHTKHGIWNQGEDGPEVWRRSVYVYRKRGLPFPLFEVFDLPDQSVSCGRRNVSTVPTQALTLLNNDFVLKQAGLFAARVREAEPSDPSRQVDLAYRLALGRAPEPEEIRLALEMIRAQNLDAVTHVLLNLNEFLYIR